MRDGAFGAVCPARDLGAALVLPKADAEAMNLQLAEIARIVTPDSHAVVLLDGAGWHHYWALTSIRILIGRK